MYAALNAASLAAKHQKLLADSTGRIFEGEAYVLTQGIPYAYELGVLHDHLKKIG